MFPTPKMYRPPIVLKRNPAVHALTLTSSTPRHQNVTEGQIPPSQPAVNITGPDGQPVAGARAIAVLTRADGFKAPNMFIPEGTKPIAGILSQPSDADGVARFDALRFKRGGVTRAKHQGFAVTVCVEGMCLPDADALTFTVNTSVAAISVARFPNFIRLNDTAKIQQQQSAGAADSSFSAAEEDEEDDTAPGESQDQARAEPIVVRMLDATGEAVEGKMLTGVKAVRLARASSFQTQVLEMYGDLEKPLALAVLADWLLSHEAALLADK